MKKTIIIIFALFLFAGTANCFFSKTDITKIELQRAINFVQNKRYNNIWNAKEIHTDKDIFFEACENYDFNRSSARIQLKLYFPKIYTKIFK